jgi:alpha-beta hydrolase superfamily lysophospholipase
LFLAITHLELLKLSTIRQEDVVRLSQNLALIPHLTHIALNPNLDRMVSHAALAADTRLQCIAFLWSSPYALADTSPLLNDTRFVCIQRSMEYHSDYRTDWLCGAVGGDDYWALADTFIAARRMGKVEYIISDWVLGHLSTFGLMHAHKLRWIPVLGT